MIFEKFQTNPFQVEISFHKLIENLEEIAQSDIDYRANYAQALLKQVESVPELRTGITVLEQIDGHKTLIRNLLSDLFPTALSKNEIKAVTIPYHNITFNYSERFQYILNHAGPDFDMVIRDFDDDRFYVMSCLLILNKFYGRPWDISQPFFYDIPDLHGFIRHYRILYNGDFLEILATPQTILLSTEDIELLMDNFHDIDLWKAKFPAASYILKGFGIMTLYDATTESAVSNLKTKLLSKPDQGDAIAESFKNIFRSIFHISDLRIGYTALNAEGNKFILSPFSKSVPSFILAEMKACDCHEMVCNDAFSELIKERKYLSISDVEKFGCDHEETNFANRLLQQEINSAIFAPVIKEDQLLGIVEVVSTKCHELNSINANKMDIVMPYLTDTISRYYSDIQNQVDAMIQNEYTTIHPSVYWKFKDEVLTHINDNRETVFHEVVFQNVYPLYGQIDVKGSSEMRNKTTKEDIVLQVNLLIEILERIFETKKLPLIEKKILELDALIQNIESTLNANSEQLALNYMQTEIHPILKQHQTDEPLVSDLIASYFDRLDPNSQNIYESRRKFDNSLSIINKKMSAILDRKQVDAQKHYPHYYERFKTDGVEHNLYIGNTITNKSEFDLNDLYHLRLWQFQVMCAMENQYHMLKPTLPYPLDVASLLLVFNHSITIRFRMDEKRFDVDGSYNARYEVVKKRIDKAFIKGTTERITQKEAITIVYTHQSEEDEYKRYIQFLQLKKRLGPNVEFFDIEDLQGVSGLKGIRVRVLFDGTSDQEIYSYDDLLIALES